jgi:hypothetical protein
MNRTDDQFWEDTVARHDLDDAELRHAEAMFASVPHAKVDPKWVEAQIAKVAVVPMRRPFMLQRVIKVVTAAAALVMLSVYRAPEGSQLKMTCSTAIRLMQADDQPPSSRASAIGMLFNVAQNAIKTLRTVRANANLSDEVRAKALECRGTIETTLLRPTIAKPAGAIEESVSDDMRALKFSQLADSEALDRLDRVTDAAVNSVEWLRQMRNPSKENAVDLGDALAKLLQMIRE